MTQTAERRTPELTEEPGAPPVIGAGLTYDSVGGQIADIVLQRRRRWGWLIGFGVSFLFVILLLAAITYLLITGVGIWGVNIPVAWGFAITNFVWWIGIGHAGTLISAILLLARQDWRTSINRFAEAMTIFAVANAGLFPILHLGRPWYFYWLIPYPTTQGIWPQFRSPLVWDLFAVATYLTVSLIFWYMGMVPDLAGFRDRAGTLWVKRLYGVLALGWRGSARDWHRYEQLYVLLAALATPLVVSVHSIVSFDFAVGILPGWHSTMFPPYFVAGALYSGFAMVLIIAIPLRSVYRLDNLVTMRHIDVMAKMMLASGLVVAYSYIMEAFMTWYSGDEFETYIQLNRPTGFYMWWFWALMAANVLIPQLLWFGRVRSSLWLVYLVAWAVNIGMWIERFIIVVQSLHRDFLPSSWGVFIPTFWDWATLAGTLGLFVALLFLFVRLLPMIPVFEVRRLLHERNAEGR